MSFEFFSKTKVVGKSCPEYCDKNCLNLCVVKRVVDSQWKRVGMKCALAQVQGPLRSVVMRRDNQPTVFCLYATLRNPWPRLGLSSRDYKLNLVVPALRGTA